MQVSWNWLSELVDLSSLAGPQALGELLTARGLEVEAIERQDQGFDKVISAQILERNPHPQADRLSLCKVSTGSGEPLQIVCGAQNMKAGDKVVLAQVGAHLPNDLKIAQSKIRGETSFGMLCSEQELKLKDTSEGILILPQDTPLGKPIAEILGRNDTVMTFKLTANRADCLSHFGMAREVAAALSLTKPTQVKAPEFSALPKNSASIQVSLDAGEKASQFFGVSVEGVKIGPSPEWLVKRLTSVGSRSINNVVDATNYVMLEFGHPVHAYDATKIAGQKISVRMAREGEVLPLLDGTEVKLLGSELVISDGERAVGLAGVMGGGNSEVSDTTTKLFLECAEFDPSLVRKASSKHQKKTDASHRFERGIDPAGLERVISRLTTLVTQLAGGKATGVVVQQSAARKSFSQPAISVSPEYFPKFLGMPSDAATVEKVLHSIDCKLEKGSSWKVTPPTYRRDLTIPEDLAEEVARSLGYDTITETIPALSTAPTARATSKASSQFALLQRAKDAMVRSGFNEAVNYSFTSKAWLAKFGMETSVPVMNPLSEEHEAMVPSLIPGLLKTVLDNFNHHFGSEKLALRLFEIRPTFHAKGEVKAHSQTDTGVEERWKLSLVMSGPCFSGGLRNELGDVDFYDLKAAFESLIETLGARGVRNQPISEVAAGVAGLFHPGQAVEVRAGNTPAGYFGLIHPKLAKELKLRAPLYLAELDWNALSALSRGMGESPQYKPLPEFPSIERDFALVVKDSVTSDKITQLALKSGRPLAKVAKIFDVYRGSQLPEGMTSVAVRVIFYEDTRSLQESEVEAVSGEILKTWQKELGAELRG